MEANKTVWADSIRFGTGTPLQTFDPHQADTGPSFSTYLALVYDGLTRQDPDNPGNIVPALATDWYWIDDVTLEFEIRQGVRFIDGTPFDARVAKDNIERMLRLKGPRISTVAAIKSVEAPNEFILRMQLQYPDPTILYNLSLSPGMMVSPAAFENEDLDLNPVGTGAWRYDRERSTIGEVHRFYVNPDYFAGRSQERANYEVLVLGDGPARLNALLSGQVDLTIVGPAEARYAEQSGFSIARRDNRWLGMTILDREGEIVPELADRRVRRALGFAVDRQAMADIVFFGYATPASQPMAELGHVSGLQNFFTYDPDKARKLLEDAGAIGFSFTVPITPGYSAPYETIQYYLRKVGINMELKVIEPGTVSPVSRSKQYPVNTIGYPTFDPDSRHLAIWDSDAAFNPFRNDNSRLDELAKIARETHDESERQRLFKEYFEIVVAEVYSVVYLHIEDLIAYDAGRVMDVRVSRYIDPMLREVKLRDMKPRESIATEEAQIR